MDDVWERLTGLAEGLVAGHLDAAQEPGGPGEDAAWRGVVRDLLDAIAGEYDGDRQCAVGALAQALHQVAAAP